MVINQASLLVGIVKNPFGNVYFQGLKEVPLDAASACLGVFYGEVGWRDVLLRERERGEVREKRGTGERERKKLIKNCINLLQ